MKFTLLTHFKEFPKRSNTGRMVLEVLGNAAEQVRWERTRPPEQLLREIEAGDVALVYPGRGDEPAADLSGISQFIIIDGTWHEARHIHQRSPYLQRARRVALKPGKASRYNLRKNQKEAGLCTAECVIEILRCLGENATAERLEQVFLANMRPRSAMGAAGSEPFNE
ncbi:tRNA-uridine aminocarboxypropyltransferase [Trichlorobacter ammonificans]|uniref:tRNA-uridine aminocarboxypropyltransferase n=1 Tax=Trichlorobacter ammonificans TaxID=2916410 RepID=A0ABM9D4C9_9BACT|nr:tRNA-uridine aminocarboxypropyltransferase [Trichlorobacter ammonificans]CAH2030104.1 tRNA-uridine aminocarboxypropyltransferase [Trichlorobacter ammonificans]